MRTISCFVEDNGHRAFLAALLQRFVRNYNTTVEIKFESARGGHGTAIAELRQYTRDIQRGKHTIPDLLVVATDGNCKGFLERKQQIEGNLKGYSGKVIYAIPDPHIERWLLLDSSAFKKVLGVGCKAPAYKCERDRYKRLLADAVIDAGEKPVVGGLEYTEDLVNEMDLDKLERVEPSFGRLLKDFRQQFQSWVQDERTL